MAGSLRKERRPIAWLARPWNGSTGMFRSEWKRKFHPAANASKAPARNAQKRRGSLGTQRQGVAKQAALGSIGKVRISLGSEG